MLPSFQENFALTVAEALRVGTPVVLTRHVNIWGDVTGAGAGAVCDTEPASIAAAVTGLLTDDARRAAAGAAGVRLVAERFTWPAAARALRAAYEEVIARHGSGSTGAG